MKRLYIDCGMGAAGDMLAAALFELVSDKEDVLKKLNSAGIPGVTFIPETSVKCGIKGTHMTVDISGECEECDVHHEHHHDHGHHHDYDHDHHHSGLHEINHIISHLDIAEKIKKDVFEIYRLIAEAESFVHGIPVTDIHFHEVGTMDAIADITAVCILIDILSPDEIIASPVHVGFGHVKCMHGILPVPAPATAHILKDIPSYGGEIQGELCTPTGAALLRYFADSFDSMPMMKMQNIGYGMGTKDFEAANCIRAILGENNECTDDIIMLSCNVDDITSEYMGFAMDRIYEAGAREVFTIPVGMKKNRIGFLINVICDKKTKEQIISSMFKYTSTIGIRESEVNRYVLDRKLISRDTPYGAVQCKISEGYGVKRVKYEYDDISKIAKENDITLEEVIKNIEKAH